VLYREYQRNFGASPNSYLAEFDFRYCNSEANGLNDADRTVCALEGIVGKRLMYRDTSVAA
jgi:hypothetical protein